MYKTQDIWYNLQEGALLSRSAASCLAEIAILEIPSKSWPQFAAQMNQLCSTAEKDEAAVALRKNSCLLIGLVNNMKQYAI